MFRNRVQAGRILARHLESLRGEDVVVLGLPRGGVPVAYEVAVALGKPLDVILVRKLGVPGQPELAMGAIGEDGVRIVNQRIVDLVGVGSDEMDEVERSERVELERRARLYRGERPRVPLEGRTAVIVDDGIATGSTMLAAARVARRQGAGRVVVAVPVAPVGVEENLGMEIDQVLVVETPPGFSAVGQFYADFTQVEDREVTDLLARKP